MFISQTTLNNERSWTPPDLEAGSIVWAIKGPRGHLWSTKFLIYSDHKASEHITKVGQHNARVQYRLDFFSAYSYALEYRKGSANGNADFLSRLPQPATDLDRTGLSRLTSPDTVGVYVIHACGFTPIEPSTPGIGLGGLVPPPSIPFNTLPPLPFTDQDLGDFRRYGPRMDHSDPVQPLHSFVAGVSVQDPAAESVSYTHLTLPTTPYV